MSGISAADTFTDGAERFEQEKYWSTVATDLEPDPIRMEEDFKKPLPSRIITLHSSDTDMFAEYRLDDVKIRCTSDAYRQHQQHQWNRVKAEAEGKRWNWTVSAIGSGLVTVIGIVASVNPATPLLGAAAIASIPAAPLVAVAAAVNFVVSLYVIANANDEISSAVDQVSKWSENPVLKIGKERDEAHMKGFPFIFTHNLKLNGEPSHTGRFHPKQVEHEYKKYFEAFCKLLIDRSNNGHNASEWVKAFNTQNPLSSNWMMYGLGEIPDYMKPVVEDFNRLESLLNDIEKLYGNLKSDVRSAAKERVDGYNKAKEEQLKPIADARDRRIATIKDERDKIFEKYQNPTDQRRQEAQRNYNTQKRAFEEDYAHMAQPVNKQFDDKIKKVEKERDEQIKKLDEQKGQQFANNYRAARELLIRAQQAWDHKGYQPVNFQQYFPYQVPSFGQAPAFGQAPQYGQTPQQGVYQPQSAAPAYPPQHQPAHHQGYLHVPSGHPGIQGSYGLAPGAGG